MNTKTKNLVAKSTSEGWARAHNFQKLLHTIMGVPDKELGTASQARSFISANKHHSTIDNITNGDFMAGNTATQLKPLLTSYQQFLLGHKKIKRKSKKPLTTKTWTPRTITPTKPAITDTVMPGIEALQDLRTFQLKHKLTIKDITHLAQTLQSLQIPRFADPSTTTRPPK